MRPSFTKQAHLEWKLQQVPCWREQPENPYYLEVVAESDLPRKNFYDLLACVSKKKYIPKQTQKIKQTSLNSHCRTCIKMPNEK
jgi:hypothetical protein